MPVYEYVCTECAEKIEVKATISEKEKGLNVVCPKCGSKKVVQFFGNIWISRSSEGGNNPLRCGPQAGAGCCG